jgi:hypothetical protein
MAEVEAEHPLDADARRTALEVISTLVNVKRVAADQLLRPAGVRGPHAHSIFLLTLICQK